MILCYLCRVNSINYENDECQTSPSSMICKDCKLKIKNTNHNEIIHRVRSFANSIYEFTKSGFYKISQDQKQERLNICESCDSMNKDNKICNECGCYLDIKTGWATESCPLGKWNALPILENTQKKPCGGCNKQNKKSE